MDENQKQKFKIKLISLDEKLRKKTRFRNGNKSSMECIVRRRIIDKY